MSDTAKNIIAELELTDARWNADEAAEPSARTLRILRDWRSCNEAAGEGDEEALYFVDEYWCRLTDALERDGVITPCDDDGPDEEPFNCRVPGLRNGCGGWIVI